MNDNHDHDNHDHEKGLPHDLARLPSRRGALAVLAAGAAAAGVFAYTGYGPMMSRAEEEVSATGTDGSQCVAHPGETAGPFPADGSNRAHGTLANVLDDSGILRTDMRTDIGGGPETAARGARLDVTARLVDVSSDCAPLAGHALYLWHCDAEGRYSLYELPERTYLRAVGVTDAEGLVRFTTVFPGCYRGRYPHMHFEVYPSVEKATGYANRILTSQLAMPEAACREIYRNDTQYPGSLAGFSASPLKRDGIFADNTKGQLAAQTLSISGTPAQGYRGEVAIGLKV